MAYDPQVAAQMNYRQPAPPRYEHEVVYIDRPAQPPRRDVSVKNITVPILLVIIGGASLFSAAFWLATNLSAIRNSIDNLQKDLTGYIQTVGERMTRIENEIDKMKTNRWTIKDHDLWCAREEVVNPNWKCVPASSSSTFTPPVLLETAAAGDAG